MKVFFGILGIIVVLWMYSCVISSHEKELRAWAAARGEVVKVVEIRSFNIGPYLLIKGNTHFYLETDKGVYWIKYGFGRTIKREVNGKYETIED